MVSWEERSQHVLAQGATGTNSKRSSAYISGVYPTHLVSGSGCYVTDTSGKTYMDFVSGLGTNILGYNHPKVTEAVRKQLDRGGPSYSLPSYLEVEVAEKLRELVPCAEKIRFLKTGNEATLAAVRIGRSYHATDYVFNEGYHGHGDIWTSLTKPAVGVKDQFYIHSLDDVSHGLVIVEPIQVNPEYRKEWAQELRKRSTVLVFDEIVTGFRVPKYTVASWWGITPDIICMGKAIANGYPLAIVAGKKEVMDCGEYFISSTYSGEAMSLAACGAVCDEIKQKSLEDLMFYGQRFCDQFNEICKPIGSHIKGYGTRGQTDFYENENTVLLFQELCKAGVIFGRAFFWNFAHMESGIEEQVLNLVSDAANKVKMGMVKLEGTPPTSTFRR